MKSVLTYVLAALMLASKVTAENQVDDASIFKGFSPKASHENMSGNNNPWTGGSTAGAIIGFSVFALSYIFVVIYIFYDINKSKNQYIEMVEEDKNIISQLRVSPGMLADWENELQLRLSGKTGEEKLDDQLFGAAATLSPAEYN